MYPTQNLGTGHADDLMYLFQMTPIIDLIPSSMDKQVSKDMVRMWTNFAIHADPNGKGKKVWKAAKKNDLDNLYYVIDENSRMENLEELDRFKSWRK